VPLLSAGVTERASVGISSLTVTAKLTTGDTSGAGLFDGDGDGDDVDDVDELGEGE
jgi:hypothetical protein